MMETEFETVVSAESERLWAILGGALNPTLEKLIGAAATAHARRTLADQAWREEGCKPDSPWLKVSRDALRDYQAALRLMLKHAEVERADPLGVE